MTPRIYSAERIRSAIVKTVAETGWASDELVADITAQQLAGWQADDASLADAARQIREYIDSQPIGRRHDL